MFADLCNKATNALKASNATKVTKATAPADKKRKISLLSMPSVKVGALKSKFAPAKMAQARKQRVPTVNIHLHVHSFGSRVLRSFTCCFSGQARPTSAAVAPEEISVNDNILDSEDSDGEMISAITVMNVPMMETGVTNDDQDSFSVTSEDELPCGVTTPQPKAMITPIFSSPLSPNTKKIVEGVSPSFWTDGYLKDWSVMTPDELNTLIVGYSDDVRRRLDIVTAADLVDWPL